MKKRGGGQIRGNHGCTTEKRKKIERNEESLRELWDNVKCTSIRIIEVPERGEREGDRKSIPRDNSQKLPKHGKGTTHNEYHTKR